MSTIASPGLLDSVLAQFTQRAAVSRTRSSRMAPADREKGRTIRASRSRAAIERIHAERAEARASRIRDAFKSADAAYLSRRSHRRTHWVLDTLACATCRDIRTATDAAQVELESVFRLPITREDIRPGGTFERSAAQRMARHAANITHGNTLVTSDMAADLVQTAAMLAWLGDDTSESDDWGVSRVSVPTIGSLYRGIKRAYALAIAAARQDRRMALAYANDAETASAARASGYGVDPVAFFDGSMSAYALKSFTTPAARWSVAPSHDDMLLAERISARAERAARHAIRAYAAERAEARANIALTAATPAHLSDSAADALRVDAATVAMLAAGVSLDDMAERLGIKSDTLARRLRSLSIRPERFAPKGREARMVHVIRTSERSVRMGTAASGPTAFSAVEVGLHTSAPYENRTPLRRAVAIEGYMRQHPNAVPPSPLPVADGIIAPPITTPLVTAPMQSAQVPLTPTERHAAAHAQARCNCGSTL